MNVIIDCIKSLADLAALLAVWFGFAGVMWLRDELRFKKEREMEDQP